MGLVGLDMAIHFLWDYFSGMNRDYIDGIMMDYVNGIILNMGLY